MRTATRALVLSALTSNESSWMINETRGAISSSGTTEATDDAAPETACRCSHTVDSWILSEKALVSRMYRTSRRTCSATSRFSSPDMGWFVIGARSSSARVGISP